MVKFDRQAFLAAAGEVNESEFKPVPTGDYVVSLEKASFKEHDSGSVSCSFGWQIDADDPNFPNQYIWWNQNVTKTDGTPNDIGLQQLSSWLMKMSEGRVNLDAFLDNPDDELEKFIGTICRVHAKQLPDEGYGIKHKITHRRTLNCVYSNPNATTGKDVAMSEEVVDGELIHENEKEMTVGDYMIFQMPGNQNLVTGKVISFVGNNEQGMVEFKLPGKTNTMLVPVANIRGFAEGIADTEHGDQVLVDETAKEFKERKVEEDEELLEEELPLVKGAMVQYMWEGVANKHPVYDINEDEGTLRVKIVNAQGKPAARKLSIPDVLVVAN